MKRHFPRGGFDQLHVVCTKISTLVNKKGIAASFQLFQNAFFVRTFDKQIFADLVHDASLQLRLPVCQGHFIAAVT